MGRVFSTFIKRPFRNFNVDNRAMKILESEDIRPAPRYERDFAATEARKEETKEKQEALLERLKLVKVVSDDSSAAKKKEEIAGPNVHLPQNRSYIEPPEYGFAEGETIPEGKVSLRMVLEFLNNHQTDPKIWNSQFIAKEYKLDVAITEQILKYFSLYNVIIPEKGQQQSRFFSIEEWKKALLPEKTITDKTQGTSKS